MTVETTLKLSFILFYFIYFTSLLCVCVCVLVNIITL